MLYRGGYRNIKRMIIRKLFFSSTDDGIKKCLFLFSDTKSFVFFLVQTLAVGMRLSLIRRSEPGFRLFFALTIVLVVAIIKINRESGVCFMPPK